MTTPRSWRDQSDQVFRHDVILSREIHVPHAPVRLSVAQTRKDMAASISKNNDKATEVVRAVAGSFGFSRFVAESTCLLLLAFGVVRAFIAFLCHNSMYAS